ncbi:DUF4007 family protein [Rhizobium leguminosarum]|uniref:DUF4007 family protein n=1 Tax=Rhizobium leguminosarum TaxID=384 RepID=UPI001C989C32|nr:DUF4007 family protein [Rhizobium leguminosarum]MBY5504090.1 DUF4007 family protein [Rhizobium leguminosarum]
MASAPQQDFRFGGHQTFALRIAWLPKAAAAIERGEDPLSNPLDGVVSLGLGKNMVEALRCWIDAYGVASKTDGRWSLTAFGRALFGAHGHDPYLEDQQTLWLLHWKIATLQTAPFFAWELLFNRWNEPTFSASAALLAFSQEAERAQRPLSPISAKQHLDVCLHTYLPGRSGRSEEALDSPLSSLRLLRQVGTRELSEGRNEQVYAFDLEPKTSLSQTTFEFCLHDWWNRELKHEETVTLNEVAFSRLSPGRVFRLPESEVRERLGALSRGKGANFELLESLNQMMVRRKQRREPLALLSKIYASEDHAHA